MKKHIKSKYLLVFVIALLVITSLILVSCTNSSNSSTNDGSSNLPNLDHNTDEQSPEDLVPEKPLATINVSNIHHGQIYFQLRRYKVGDKVKLTFIPDKGYKYKANTLIVNDVLIPSPDSTMEIELLEKNTNLSCLFEKVSFDIDTSKVKNGAVKIKGSGTKLGDVVTLDFIPDQGYIYNPDNFSIIDSDGYPITLDNNNKFLMPAASIIIEGSFDPLPIRNIAIKSFTGGSLKVSATSAKVGEPITVSDIKPEIGYEVLDGSLSLNQFKNGLLFKSTKIINNKFIMPDNDVEVAITFKKIDYPIIINGLNGGQLKLTKNIANMNDKIEITIIEERGYKFNTESLTIKDENGDLIPIKNNVFVMPASNITINANFIKLPLYSVNIDNISNGTIIPSEHSFYQDENVFINDIIPDEGYRLLENSLKLRTYKDGQMAEFNILNNKFIMPASDVKLYAEFVKIDYSITIKTIINGDLKIKSANTTGQIGDLIEFETLPFKTHEYKFGDIVVKDCENNSINLNGKSFIMPASNITICGSYTAKPTYTITIQELENGVIKSNVASSIAGEEIKIEILPINGFMYKEGTLQYQILDVNGDIIDSTAIINNSFFMPQENVILYAEFEKIIEKDYNVVTPNLITGGSVKANTSISKKDQPITIEVSTDPGYKQNALYYTYIDNDNKMHKVNIENNTFIMPEENIEIIAEFVEIIYTITINQTQNGNITVSSKQAHYGDEIIITIIPDIGYMLEQGSLKQNAKPIENNKFIIIDEDVTITGNFILIPPNQHSIKVSSIKNGTINTNVLSQELGNSITATITPALGYRYVVGSFKVNGIPSELTFEMPNEDVILTCEFEKIVYNISFESTLGQIVAEKNQYTYQDLVNLKITPNEGYCIKNGSIKANGKTVGTSFKMPAQDTIVTCTFEKKNYNITSETQHGNIITKVTQAQFGDIIEFTIAPTKGYKLIEGSIKVNGVNITGESFKMPSKDVILTCEFEKIIYNITTEITNGNINVQPTATIGDKISLDLITNAGYQLVEGSLKIKYYNGTKEVTKAVFNNTFTMPAAAVKIVCEVEPMTFFITVEATNGVVNIPSSAKYGTTVTFTTTPNKGYELVQGSIYINNNKLSFNNFKMPSENITIKCKFKAINYNITVDKLTNGKISVQPYAIYNEKVSINIIPDLGYELKPNSLKVNGIAISGTSFIMDAKSTNINCEFQKKEYKISSSTQNGTIKAVSSSTFNQIIKLEIIPDMGYSLVKDSITINGEKINGTSFIMPAENVNIHCEFEKIPYSITTIVENGEINISQTATYRENVIFEIIPNKGYQLKAGTIKVNGNIINVNSFEMPARDVIITCEMEKRTFNISVSTENGTIIVNNSALFESEVTIDVVPNIGYKLKDGSLKANGIEIINNKFIMPGEDVTIYCDFEKIIYTITVKQDNATVIVAPNATFGDKVDLTINPFGGYKVTEGSIKINGGNVKYVDKQFIMPNENVEITYALELVIYKVKNISDCKYPYTMNVSTIKLGDKIDVQGSLPPEIEYKLFVGGVECTINSPITSDHLQDAENDTITVKVSHKDNRIVGKVYNPDLYSDSTYVQKGMREQIPMHPENFGDTLVVEKLNGIYYVTIEVVNNTKCERMYWKGRKDQMYSDSIIIKNGLNSKHMFAFTKDHIRNKINLQIGGGKMPLDPPFAFTIDFNKLEFYSSSVANTQRPQPFL